MAKNCENCGIEVPILKVRQRVAGKKVCDLCAEAGWLDSSPAWECDECGHQNPESRDRSGRETCQGCGAKRRPFEYPGGEKAATLDFDPYENRWIVIDQDMNPIPRSSGTPGESSFYWPADEAHSLIGSTPPNGYGYPVREVMPGSHWSIVWADGRWAVRPRRNASLQVEAHDSGDGETIYHCPFCGSGNVVARSDKSAECGFCNTVFTVQVQPMHPYTPQTIDGKPYNDPDMPGEVTDPNLAGTQPTQPAGGEKDDSMVFKPEGQDVFDPTPASGPQNQVNENREKKEPAFASKTAADEDIQWRWDEMDRLGEALDAVVTKKRTGPQWERQPYSDAPRDGWRCLVVGDGGKVMWCKIEPTLLGEYEVRIYDDRGMGNGPIEGTDDPVQAVRIAERMMERAAGWRFWDESRRRTLEMEPYRTASATPYFITADGNVLGQEAMVKHLAIRFADDRDAVLERVRAENARR
jgi:hypothetical protein